MGNNWFDLSAFQPPLGHVQLVREDSEPARLLNACERLRDERIGGAGYGWIDYAVAAAVALKGLGGLADVADASTRTTSATLRTASGWATPAARLAVTEFAALFDSVVVARCKLAGMHWRLVTVAAVTIIRATLRSTSKSRHDSRNIHTRQKIFYRSAS